MEAIEFEVSGHQFRATKMSAFAQFHVARRVGPFITKLGDLEALASSTKDSSLNEVLASVEPLLEMLAAMSDQNAEYILNACLDVVRIKQGTSYCPVRSNGGGLMYDFLGLPEMAQIAWKVMEHNLAGFFTALPGSKPAAGVPAV